MLRASFLFVLSLLTVLLAGCSDTSSLNSLSLSGKTMGTTYNITVVSPPQNLDQASLQKEIDQRLQALNQQMSTYLDDSDIILFNRLAINNKQKIQRDFLDVILLSQEISALTEGRFDITIGTLVELWGFGKQAEQKIPDRTELDNALSKVGWQYLIVDQHEATIEKQRPLWLDVSAVAKGFAVDVIAVLLEGKGVEHYLVEIGGEMRVKGHNRQQQDWRIGIEIPSLVQQQAQQLVKMTNKSIATSGDYRNYFEENGQRFSHTIDPNTGKPVKHNIASVSVISETAARADALATALNVLGEEAALNLAKGENLAAYFILYDDSKAGDGTGYRIVYTDPFKKFIQ